MPIDKILISHIVAELVVICGVTFYYHKKCNNLQQQINELNSKLEKLNVNNYLNSLKRQEQFEMQTIQHVNKIYSLLNNNGINLNSISNLQSEKIIENNIKENFYNNTNLNGSNVQNISNDNVQKTSQSTNPLTNAISMFGPLASMVRVVMEPKPPHPNEVFENIDIKKELNKIVEIEDDNSEINSEYLDNELKDELNDLHSNMTSRINTPLLTPKIINNNISNIELCENNECKLSFGEISYPLEEKNENKLNDKLENDKSDKSSPLRYISQNETKRGRPKKSTN